MADKYFLPVPKPEPGKKKGGKAPKQAGNRVERQVAKQYGGERTPGSGAIKHSSKNLTGDVEVKLPTEQIKFEVKYSGSLTSTGLKTFPMTLKVLTQMINEACEAHQLGALHIQYKGEPIKEGGVVVMWVPHFMKLLQAANMEYVDNPLENVVE
jgi:hypothetical protein